MHFRFDPLNPGFVVGKPITQDNYKEQILDDLEKNGNLIITRKRDGWKLYAVIYKGKVKIYTVGISEIDDRLEHIKREILKLGYPSGTVLCGEGLVDLNDKDDFSKVGSILQSNRDLSLDLQKRYGKIRFMIFGIVMHEMKPWTKPYDVTLADLKGRLKKHSLKYIFEVPVLNCSLPEAKEIVLSGGWEGLVLYDRNFYNTFRIDGKNPQRPKGCYKWKPIIEDDFIVRSFIPNPEKPKRLKELVLSQIDPKTGEEFACGKLGSFSEKMREELRVMKYPFVVQVEFEARFKSGKIRNARFVRLRDDKKVEECVAPYNWRGI